jgi:hypothetical protein
MICDEQHIHKTLVAINFILALKSERSILYKELRIKGMQEREKICKEWILRDSRI